MGIFRVSGLSKAFGIETLFTDVSFEMRRGEKIGLIGANGTGKTTLMRCLLGLEEYDSGQVIVPAGETIGYVEQDVSLDQGTLYEELLAAYQDVLSLQEKMKTLEKAIAAERHEARLAQLMEDYGKVVERFERSGGYEYESMIRRITAGLGFTAEDLARPLATFSGGQKTRISLAKVLTRQPDFLFLDEPTNHLDIDMVEWLEEFLADYAGGVLIISHDRYFLDKVATRVFELEQQRLTSYRGNYSDYLALKAERMAALESAYEKQQEYIAKTEAYINKYRAGIKSKQARGRQSQLDRLERIVLPEQSAKLDFAFEALGESAERVAELIDTAMQYGQQVIFKNLSLLIRRGEGVALVGPNGAGKTSLLKMLIGELEPAAGQVKLGNRVRVGYFSQEHEGLNNANRLIDEIMYEYNLSEERARNVLGAFLFSGDDVYKLIGSLSGGEKARLALLKIMMTGANFLVLDEPTNHLDIPSKEAVEEAILSFPGTFLTVSHDRYFLDKVADRVLELADGRLTEYAGNYSYYREKKAALAKEAARDAASAAAAATTRPETGKKPGVQRQRKPDRAKVLEKLEGEIAELEVIKTMLERQLNDPANHANPETSKALADEYESVQQSLTTKYDEWLELTEE